MISFKSEVENTTAIPCCDNCTIMRNTSPLAPMSIPRVGSSRNSTFGLVNSERPITTFLLIAAAERLDLDFW